MMQSWLIRIDNVIYILGLDIWPQLRKLYALCILIMSLLDGQLIMKSILVCAKKIIWSNNGHKSGIFVKTNKITNGILCKWCT